MTAHAGPERPWLVSYFCGDPYYAHAAAALRARCEALGIPILIEPAPDGGAYWRNTLLKPAFILEKLVALHRDLIWIDADTTLHEDHPEFRALTADLTVASHTGDLTGVKASPIGFSCGPRSLAFLAAWALACQARLDAGEVDLDHDILKYEILPDFAGRLSLRLMGDPTRPRDFTEGRTLTNGLSRRAREALPYVLARNRQRSARFAVLRLEHFALALPEPTD